MEPWNTFIEGDNLDVLRALADAGERFDLIYIDPPYNTGSAFAYHDDLRGADGRRSGRHMAWVAMMRPRLEAARAVMSSRAAIYVSIDDNETAYLRLLLDEIFGEEQFLAQVVVNLNPKGRQLGGGFATSHEYLLIYAADAGRCVLDAASPDLVDPSDFPHEAADGRRFRRLPLRNTNKKFNPVTSPTLHYPLWGSPETGRVAVAAFEGAQEIWPVFGDGRPAVWRWSAPLVERRADDLMCRLVPGRLGERIDVYQRDWLDVTSTGSVAGTGSAAGTGSVSGAGSVAEAGPAPGAAYVRRRKKLRTIWLAEEIGSTDTAVAELKGLVGHVFESPKPTGLLRRILATMPSDARVLDFFAGSGTTGHAVAMANVADGGRRTCVSINHAEPVRPGSNAALAGLETVADITRERLRAVAVTLGGGLDERAQP